MSSSSRPLSSSLVAVPESCAAASPYFSYSSTSSPHSAFSSSPSPSFSSSSSSSHSSSSFSSTLPSSNFGSTSAEYYQQNHHHHHQLPMMAASLDGSNMMKLYNSNGNSKLESFELNNNSWNGGLYGNGTTKVPAYQQQQSQPQQQLDQINFLVRKECCNEIDQAVKELGISADPFNWSVSDVQKWLLWMQRWVQLPSLKLEHFAMDGMSLCALTEEDFRQRVPNGEKLYAKLDIWRMAFNYFGATDFDSIFGEFQENLDNSNNSYGQQQQQQQQQYCASPYSTSSSTDASSLYSGSSPISPEGYGVSNSGSGCGSLPTYAESMYGGGMCGGNGSIASPASPASSSHSSVNSCSPYGQQQQNSYGYGQTMVAPQQQQQQQQQQYGKASLLPMNDFSNMANTGAMITAVVNGGGAQPLQQQRMVATSDYGSDAIPSDDDDMSDDEKCFLEFQHHHHRMTLQQQQQQQHQQQLMQLQQQQQQQQQMQSVVGNGRGSLPLSVPQIKVESRADYSPSASPVYHQGLQHHQQHQHQQHLMQQQQQFGHPRPPVHHHQQHQQRQYAQHPNGMVVGNHSISVVKSELPSSSSSTTTTPIAVPAAPVPTAPAVAVAPVRTSSSHIHLWQFLKELLSGPHQYGSSIRWLDRSKGVFKIEDSVSVAKLWGARKNRPAMNYDKLSRSIRQYYKKGIMKKTERSQRLVYQFCAPYAL